MLFIFGEMRSVMMWMQNTPSPLDMVFLDDKGRVSAIHENAVPFSEDIISSQGPRLMSLNFLPAPLNGLVSSVATKRSIKPFVASVAVNASHSERQLI